VKKRPVYIVYFAIFGILVWADRFFKNLVVSNMKLGEAFPSQDSFASIRYTINTGVSFSLFSGHPQTLIALQSVLFVAVAIACIMTYRKLRHPVLQTGLTWVVSGGMGNLIDRISYGYVIDYISVGSFPVWNFADMCIVGGCILLGVYILVIFGKQQKADAAEPDE